METVFDINKTIYLNQDSNIYSNVEKFLNDNGFNIYNIVKNDITNCEYNIYFKRND